MINFSTTDMYLVGGLSPVLCYSRAMIEISPILENLRWHVDIGADEAIGEMPVDRFALVDAPPVALPVPRSSDSQRPVTASTPLPQPSDELVKAATEMARQATDVDALRAALETFEGFGLKKTATKLVFIDGNPAAKLMLVGEVPGAHEDRQGVPFVGPSGELLDKMLASVGVARNEVLLSNTIFWRPPGNRTPTSQETAICLPFIKRLVELVNPEILVTLGGPASKALLGETQGVGRLRGRWFSYKSEALEAPIDATAMFHPSYLLLTPSQKRAAWQDLLMIKEKLSV